MSDTFRVFGHTSIEKDWNKILQKLDTILKVILNKSIGALI